MNRSVMHRYPNKIYSNTIHSRTNCQVIIIYHFPDQFDDKHPSLLTPMLTTKSYQFSLQCHSKPKPTATHAILGQKYRANLRELPIDIGKMPTCSDILLDTTPNIAAIRRPPYF